MKNPYTNHANWLVQNDRHGKTNLAYFIKKFKIAKADEELFIKRMEFLCYRVFDEGAETQEIESKNKFRELIGAKPKESDVRQTIDFRL